MPLFSIVMPALDSAEFIESAITSVTEQSFRDFELLVSDDESCDGTAAIVERLAAKDDRIRLLRHRRTGAAGGNRNFALRHARGHWVAFLDADDLWPRDHLLLYAEAIGAVPEARMFFSDYCRFTDAVPDRCQGVLEEKRFFDQSVPYVAGVDRLAGGTQVFRLNPGPLLALCCLYYCPISTPAVALHRRTLVDNGIEFREDWKINEDFHVWMRMLETAPAAVLREVLFFYRTNPASLTSDRIRYFEGMARSHDEWRRRIHHRLSTGERHVYRDKVSAFLHAVAWEQSQRGHPAAAALAALRALRVRRRWRDWLAVPRSFLRALLRRARPPTEPVPTTRTN